MENYQDLTPTILFVFLITVVAAYTTMEVVKRASKTQGKMKKLWGMAGAIAMGLGIWSSHLLILVDTTNKMRPIENAGWILASLGVGSLVSLLIVWVMITPHDTKWLRLLRGSVLFTIDLYLTHFLSIAAYHPFASIELDLVNTAVSILYAFVMAWFGLSLFFMRLQTIRSRYLKIGGTLLVALAVVGFQLLITTSISVSSIDAGGGVETQLFSIVPFFVASICFLFLLVVLISAMKDQKNAIRLALQSEMRYNSLFDHNSEMVMLCDRKGRVIKINAAMTRITGYESDDLVDRTYFHLVTKEETPNTMRRFHNTMKGTPQDEEVNMWHKDGHEITLNIRTMPILSSEGIVGLFAVGRDITLQKRIDEELKRNRERLSRANKIAKIGHWELEAISNRFRFSTEFLHIIGRTADEIGNTLEEYLRIVHPEDREEVSLAFDQAFSGHPSGIEYRIVLPKGGICYLQQETEVFFDEWVREIRLFGTIQNVTERKQVESELSETRIEFEEMVSMMHGLIFRVVKHEDTFTYTVVEGDLLSRYGLTRGQILGGDFWRIIPKTLAKQIHEFLNLAWSSVSMEHAEFVWNGIHSQVTVRPIFKGEEVVALIGSCVDVTERAQAAEQVRDRERQHRLIVENVSDLITIIDRNGVVTYVSPSHQQVLGVTEDKLLGQAAVEWIHSEDMAMVSAHFQHMYRTQEAVLIRFRFRHGDGSWIHVEVKASPFREGHGDTLYYILIGRDISHQVQAYEALRKSDKLELAGGFAASIANDLRNPLTAIKGFSQWLRKEEQDPIRRNYLSVMVKEVKQIERLLDGYTLLATPYQSFYKEQEVGALLEAAIAKVDEVAVLHNVHIQTVFESQVPTIKGDDEQIKQLFCNLLYNAIEAMEQGGKILIEQARDKQGQVMIKIKDQGCGIAPSDLHLMEEPFYTTKAIGTGIGLAVCRKILINHKGDMRLTSEIGVGTTVTVMLPIA